MANSVLESQTTDSIASQIKLLLTYTIANDKVLIIVEGTDDKKFYSRYFDETNTMIYQAIGCDRLNEIVKNNIENKDHFIVIKDADFCHIMHVSSQYSNMFMTDAHDYEMMIVTSTDSFWKALLHEYLENNKVILNEVKKVPEEIQMYSWLKLYSMVKTLNVNFKSFKLSLVYDGEEPVSQDKCFDKLASMPKSIMRHIEKLDFDQTLANYAAYDLMQLTNGHDFCEGVCYKYRKMTGKSLSTKEIESCLRLSFSEDDFKTTNLYKNISVWANALNLHLFH